MSSDLAAAAHQAFWASTLAMALVIAACALVVGVTVALALLRRSKRGSVSERVGEFLAAAGSANDQSSREGQPAIGALTRTERSLDRERWWDEFKVMLDIARIDRPAIEVVYLTVGCSLGGAVLLTALTGSVLGALAALVLVPLMARSLINALLKRQRTVFGDQLPAHLQELASAMRAGHSMVSGLGLLAEGASEPSQGEFQRVIADEQLGMPLEHALRLIAVRMNAQDMEQVSLVAELNRQTGGNMAEVLDRVAESVRARAELNRELRTLTAQARGSRWIVTLIPPALLALIYLANPTYLEPLFSTATGHLLLAIAVGMIVAGSLVMSRIIRIEV
jgi:tight adherence protein B